MSGVDGFAFPIEEWPSARCSRDFCVLALERGHRDWHILMARSKELVEERALAAACARADIVIADRYLPASCQPRWLKADRGLLNQTGGIALNLVDERITTVAEREGEHGWWQPK